MRTDSLSSIPDSGTIAEVIRLADEREAERYGQSSSNGTVYCLADTNLPFSSQPRRYALLNHLRQLPEETVAALDALFKVGRSPGANAAMACSRFRTYFEVNLLPIHRRFAADDLVAKSQLAHNLRRGVKALGISLETRPEGR
jgi:hypothetical protein